ncbi:putative membrane protein [Rhizobium tibeticum]|uniref:DUF1622 domain-containing protein n=1 Tax=Rhizobium tibeticum TaxID=501024 RepID=UPI0027861EF7|nr:DUF1622 domain-containing protein [Rhizobium tibeticum]MDP9810056.1 putative membrane protein [Rhizobium tibeticum]
MERSTLMGLIAPVLEPLASLLEFFGVVVIVIGVILATTGYVRDVASQRRETAYSRYRANLGRGILLGLEILIGADIIATIISPLTWESVGLLGLIVLIRTFLSFSLEAEIDGQWPWRRQEGRERPE